MGHIVGAHKDFAGKSSSLAGVHVLGKDKIKIALDKRIAYFLLTMTYPTNDVLDPAIVKGKKAGYVKDYLNDTCVNAGAGQFIFKCRNHRDDPNHSGFFATGSTPSITLIPNPNWWGPHPKVKLYMPAIPDVQTSYKDYKSGQIDETPHSHRERGE